VRRSGGDIFVHSALRAAKGNVMSKLILLVEDNASDEKLTLLAFKQCGVANRIVVVRDGAERSPTSSGATKRPT
jgi:hypothetical protein